MGTVHIEADEKDIAKKVLMPGDPNRATYIANKYLENAKLVNRLRGELAYTGTYKNVPITIFSSGMGIASMGIYSHELFDHYNVDEIIRIGTAGSYDENLKVYDILVVDSAYSNTHFDEDSGRENISIINSSSELNGLIMNTSRIKGINATIGRVHTSDAFYTESSDYTSYKDLGCKAVEMETYALLYNAKKYYKKATAILTISDNLITHEEINPIEREQKLDQMILLALESIIKN
jgi:purine-nucleoside phosphorylase